MYNFTIIFLNYRTIYKENTYRKEGSFAYI